MPAWQSSRGQVLIRRALLAFAVRLLKIFYFRRELRVSKFERAARCDRRLCHDRDGRAPAPGASRTSARRPQKAQQFPKCMQAASTYEDAAKLLAVRGDASIFDPDTVVCARRDGRAL